MSKTKLIIDEELIELSKTTTSTELAEHYGTTRASVYRLYKRAPETNSIPSRRRVKDLRQTVDDMKPLDAVDYLLHYIQTHQLDEANQLHPMMQYFTKTQGRIVNLLISKPIVSHDDIYANLSDDTLPKTVSVHLYKIRKIFKSNQWQASIKNIWGSGYRLEREFEFKFPWEQE